MAEASRFAAFEGLGGKLAERADQLTLQERKAVEFAQPSEPRFWLAGRPE
jgi:hypothetical protein